MLLAAAVFGYITISVSHCLLQSRSPMDVDGMLVAEYKAGNYFLWRDLLCYGHFDLVATISM